jgi:hypothetical protein
MNMLVTCSPMFRKKELLTPYSLLRQFINGSELDSNGGVGSRDYMNQFDV